MNWLKALLRAWEAVKYGVAFYLGKNQAERDAALDAIKRAEKRNKLDAEIDSNPNGDDVKRLRKRWRGM